METDTTGQVETPYTASEQQVETDTQLDTMKTSSTVVTEQMETETQPDKWKHHTKQLDKWVYHTTHN